MNIHPDELAREKQLQEHQKRTCFPKYIKPWNGHPLQFVKLNENATTPNKANESDAGFDLYASHGAILEKHTHKLIKTGIAMQIPKGYVGLIWPRSGMAYKYGIDVFAGVIDSGYRGEIMMKFTRGINHYCVGDRIGQIMILPYPQIEFEEAEKLSETNRGSGGFGSTGE